MTPCTNHPSRRDVIRGIGAGAVGLLLGGKILKPAGLLAADGSPLTRKGGLYKKAAPPAKVGLVKGNDLRNITYQALKKIEDEILGAIGEKRILIKPNFVSTDRQLAATHVDSVRGILDFLNPHYKRQIIVGESTASGKGTFDGFKNFGYMTLEKEYNVKLIDLNKQSWQYRYVFGEEHRPTPIRIISDFLDSETYIISAAKMKTHDRVVTTLSLKNVLLGSPLND